LKESKTRDSPGERKYIPIERRMFVKKRLIKTIFISLLSTVLIVSMLPISSFAGLWDGISGSGGGGGKDASDARVNLLNTDKKAIVGYRFTVWDDYDGTGSGQDGERLGHPVNIVFKPSSGASTSQVKMTGSFYIMTERNDHATYVDKITAYKNEEVSLNTSIAGASDSINTDWSLVKLTYNDGGGERTQFLKTAINVNQSVNTYYTAAYKSGSSWVGIDTVYTYFYKTTDSEDSIYKYLDIDIDARDKFGYDPDQIISGDGWGTDENMLIIAELCGAETVQVGLNVPGKFDGGDKIIVEPLLLFRDKDNADPFVGTVTDMALYQRDYIEHYSDVNAMTALPTSANTGINRYHMISHYTSGFFPMYLFVAENGNAGKNYFGVKALSESQIGGSSTYFKGENFSGGASYPRNNTYSLIKYFVGAAVYCPDEKGDPEVNYTLTIVRRTLDSSNNVIGIGTGGTISSWSSITLPVGSNVYLSGKTVSVENISTHATSSTTVTQSDGYAIFRWVKDSIEISSGTSFSLTANTTIFVDFKAIGATANLVIRTYLDGELAQPYGPSQSAYGVYVDSMGGMYYHNSLSAYPAYNDQLHISVTGAKTVRIRILPYKYSSDLSYYSAGSYNEWYSGNSSISIQRTYNIDLCDDNYTPDANGNVYIDLYFYTLTLEKGDEGISNFYVSCNGSNTNTSRGTYAVFYEGFQVYVSVTPASGESFVRWENLQGGGINSLTANDAYITVTETTAYAAYSTYEPEPEHPDPEDDYLHIITRINGELATIEQLVEYGLIASDGDAWAATYSYSSYSGTYPSIYINDIDFAISYADAVARSFPRYDYVSTGGTGTSYYGPDLYMSRGSLIDAPFLIKDGSGGNTIDSHKIPIIRVNGIATIYLDYYTFSVGHDSGIESVTVNGNTLSNEWTTYMYADTSLHYYEISNASISATPADGYNFQEWDDETAYFDEDNGSMISFLRDYYRTNSNGVNYGNAPIRVKAKSSIIASGYRNVTIITRLNGNDSTTQDDLDNVGLYNWARINGVTVNTQSAIVPIRTSVVLSDVSVEVLSYTALMGTDTIPGYVSYTASFGDDIIYIDYYSVELSGGSGIERVHMTIDGVELEGDTVYAWVPKYTRVSIDAEALDQYQFDTWRRISGNVLANYNVKENSITITMLTSYIAEASEIPVTIIINVITRLNGVAITADQVSAYGFSNWAVICDEYINNPDALIEIPADEDLNQIIHARKNPGSGGYVPYDAVNDGDTVYIDYYIITYTVNNSSYGTVSQDNAIVLSGTTLETDVNTNRVGSTIIVATPTEIEGFITLFSSWTNGNATVTEATTVTANFTRVIRTYTLTVVTRLNGADISSSNSLGFVNWGHISTSSGTIIDSDFGSANTAVNTFTLSYGTSAQITAFTDSNGSSYGSLYGVPSITVRSNSTYYINYFTLELIKGTGISTVSGSGIYLLSTSVTISATALSNYDFDSWTVEEGNSPANTGSASTSVTIRSKTTLTANATEEAHYDINPIAPNADYRIDTDVITSFRIVNPMPSDLLPSSGFKVVFTVRSSSNSTVYTETLNDVVCPAVESNLYSFRWHVPKSLTIGSNVSCTAQLISRVNGVERLWSSAELINTISAKPSYVTPDTKFESNKGYVPPTVPLAPETMTSTSWNIWEYSNGVFTKRSYSMSIDNAFTVMFDATMGVENSQVAYYDVSGKLVIPSGYGFYTEINDLSNVSLSTGLQYAYMLVPEFNYVYEDGCARTLVYDNAKDVWILNDSDKDNGSDTYGPYHFTPLWFPDGNYTVQLVFSDIWTPMGMLAITINANIGIEGSVYDHWHIN